MVDILLRVGIKSRVDRVRLKLLVETGTGTPDPNDPHISGDGAD